MVRVQENTSRSRTCNIVRPCASGLAERLHVKWHSNSPGALPRVLVFSGRDSYTVPGRLKRLFFNHLPDSGKCSADEFIVVSSYVFRGNKIL